MYQLVSPMWTSCRASRCCGFSAQRVLQQYLVVDLLCCLTAKLICLMHTRACMWFHVVLISVLTITWMAVGICPDQSNDALFCMVPVDYCNNQLMAFEMQKALVRCICPLLTVHPQLWHNVQPGCITRSNQMCVLYITCMHLTCIWYVACKWNGVGCKREVELSSTLLVTVDILLISRTVLDGLDGTSRASLPKLSRCAEINSLSVNHVMYNRSVLYSTNVSWSISRRSIRYWYPDTCTRLLFHPPASSNFRWVQQWWEAPPWDLIPTSKTATHPCDEMRCLKQLGIVKPQYFYVHWLRFETRP